MDAGRLVKSVQSIRSVSHRLLRLWSRWCLWPEPRYLRAILAFHAVLVNGGNRCFPRVARSLLRNISILHPPHLALDLSRLVEGKLVLEIHKVLPVEAARADVLGGRVVLPQDGGNLDHARGRSRRTRGGIRF